MGALYQGFLRKSSVSSWYHLDMSEDAFPVRKLTRDAFPPLLFEIPDPPTVLYARGSSVLKPHVLAVVGSRDCTPYGREVAETLLRGLQGYPISIVSGLARGMDTIAHETALRAGLHTIAVPGSGLADQVLYPRRNQPLAYAILHAGGGLLSELEPQEHAAPWTFPKRNRIMAGMAHATLIIEAAEKSGTLITARLALEYNREVITVPGPIGSPTSYGPHALIKDGATPVTTPRDILDVLGIPPHTII